MMVNPWKVCWDHPAMHGRCIDVDHAVEEDSDIDDIFASHVCQFTMHSLLCHSFAIPKLHYLRYPCHVVCWASQKSMTHPYTPDQLCRQQHPPDTGGWGIRQEQVHDTGLGHKGVNGGMRCAFKTPGTFNMCVKYNLPGYLCHLSPRPCHLVHVLQVRRKD